MACAPLCRNGIYSIIARDRTVMRGFPVREIEQDFVDIAPAPSFRRIITLDDRVAGSVEMLGRVFVGRIVAAADMAAAAADAQMQPYTAALQALLAAERARRDALDTGDVRAALCHSSALPLKRRFRGIAEKAVERGNHLRPLADGAADPLDRSRAHIADGKN